MTKESEYTNQNKRNITFSLFKMRVIDGIPYDRSVYESDV